MKIDSSHHNSSDVEDEEMNNIKSLLLVNEFRNRCEVCLTRDEMYFHIHGEYPHGHTNK